MDEPGSGISEPRDEGARREGAPPRPLLEAGLLFAAFYLVAYLPTDPAAAGASIARPAWHLGILAQLLPKALFLLYLMDRAEGLAAFGVGSLRPRHLPRAALAALGALGVALLPGAMAALAGFPPPRNPLTEAIGGAAAPAALMLPLALCSSLAVGYGEELFFRSYLMRRLEGAGLAPAVAALASALLFGSAHGIQGVLGLVGATSLGLWFAFLRTRGEGIHALGLGHALYDLAVILAALYGRGGSRP